MLLVLKFALEIVFANTTNVKMNPNTSKNAARKPNYRKFWTWMVELSAYTGGKRNSITLGSTNFTMQ